MKRPPLRHLSVENFKAVCDSGRINFGWLTVLVGNNGSGKSSLIEGLETFRDVVLDGVDAAFERWHDFEHALNKTPRRSLRRFLDSRAKFTRPMKVHALWRWLGEQLDCQQAITQGENDALFIEQEQIILRRPDRTERWTRNENGEVFFQGKRAGHAGSDRTKMPRLADGASMLKQFAWEAFGRWQFLMLNPDRMGHPVQQQARDERSPPR